MGVCTGLLFLVRRGLGSWHDAGLGEISHPDKITDGFMIGPTHPPLLFANAGHGIMLKTNGSQLHVDKIHWIGGQPMVQMLKRQWSLPGVASLASWRSYWGRDIDIDIVKR